MKQQSSSGLPAPFERFASHKVLSAISLAKHMSDPVETARRMQKYTKFLVKRHPFERLVSGYARGVARVRQMQQCRN